MKDDSINTEAESLIFEAQGQSIRTNSIKAKREKSQEKSKCRMCGQTVVIFNHILNENQGW